MKRWIAVLIPLMLCAGGSEGTEIAFLGIADGAAPAFEQEFSTLLKKDLLAESADFDLVDERTVTELRRRIDVNSHPAVSRTLVKHLMEFAGDTTLVVWGRISDYSIRPTRKLIRSFVTGNVEVSLNIYSLRFRKYAFAGRVTVQVEQAAGWIFFDRLEKTVHVSARQRVAMVKELQRQAAHKSAGLIAAVLTSQEKNIAKIEGADARKYREPSLSDLFDMPSVEGEQIPETTDEAAAVEETGAEEEPAAPAEAGETAP